MKIMAVLAVLLAAALFIGAASAADVRNVTNGGVAFVYETINISVVDEKAMASTSPILIKFSEGSNPSAVNTIYGKWVTNAGDKNATFDLYESVVGGNYGTYYATTNHTNASKVAAVSIWYPEISIQAELTTGDPTANNLAGTTSGDSIDGKTINKDTNVTFMINVPKIGPANDSATLNTDLDTNFTSSDPKDKLTAKLVFTTPVGGKTTAFGMNNYVASNDLPYEFKDLYLNASQMKYVSVYAGTDATAGTWTVQAEFTGYKPFADNAVKSNALTFTLQSTTLTITAAKDSVVRSNPFTVTIQGSSNTVYNVSIENPDLTDVNPGLQPGQNGYQSDSGYKDNSGNLICGDFKTDASGKRTIQYNTAADTEDKTYTIKVTGYKDSSLDNSNYDKVKVKVEKGSVTIAASGDGSYYLGQEIKLTGTNTDSSNVFLFITGPNLKYTDGIVLKDVAGDGSQIPAYNATLPVDVKTDNTWEYKLDTSKVALDDGAYTIYATSRLTNGKSSGELEISANQNSKYNVYGTKIGSKYYAVKLSDSEYATVSVNLKKPFLSAVPSGTVVAKGDKIYIRGTAEGDPNYLQLYIFGPNFYEINTINVEDDGSYEKKIEIGSGWASNQYYVVIEHPMENGMIDVHDTGANTNPRTLYIKNAGNAATNQSSFVVEGTGKLQSSNAANALTTMIDSANIDDIYTKLTFTVAEPWIKIVNPGDQAIGSKFTITGTTNLAVDDQILIEVISSSFNAVDKTQSSATSGVSQTTKVAAGEGGDNTWSIEVDTTNWKLDEYTIKAAGIEVDVTTTTNFNLVEKVVTQTPTATTTGAPATTTATATATATPSTPGFGAFIALAGLGAVALLVLRRN